MGSERVAGLSEYFGENKVEVGHGRRSLRSGVVSIIARGLNALIQVGSVLCLARLLTPEDYGLVGMVLAVTGFAPVLVNLGTPDAVAQRSKIEKGEVSALFWITLFVGIASTLMIAAAGPLIARFYNEPRLAQITLASSLTFLMVGLHSQHYALMRRAMKFEELAVIDVTTNVLSAAIAIGMALAGFAYWALVLRPVTLNFFLAAGVWLRCGWVPRKPEFTRGVRGMLKLGANITGFTLTDFVGKSSDRVVIGYRNGAASLGFYQNAMFVYDNVLDVLIAPLHGVAVSSLSKVRDDLAELKRLWSKALNTLSFYAMPAFGVLALNGQDAIVFLLGEKWARAGALLGILALRGIPHCVERTLGWLHVTAGRTDRWLRWGLLATGAQLAALACGLPFGPQGIVIAFVICMFVLFLPALSYAGQPLGIRARDVLGATYGPMIASLFGLGIGFLVKHFFLSIQPGMLRAAILTAGYIVLYLVTCVWLLKVRAPVAVILSLAREALPARVARLVPSYSLTK